MHGTPAGWDSGCRCYKCSNDHAVVDEIMVHALFEGVVRIHEVPGGLNRGEIKLLQELFEKQGLFYYALEHADRPGAPMQKTSARALVQTVLDGRTLPKLTDDKGGPGQRTRSITVECRDCGAQTREVDFRTGTVVTRCRECRALRPSAAADRTYA